jgi:hypothetical protein
MCGIDHIYLVTVSLSQYLVATFLGNSLLESVIYIQVKKGGI